MIKLIKYLILLFIAIPVFAQQNTIPQVPDITDQEVQVYFDGAWLPDLDPAEIGMKNYSELKNLRYSSDRFGLEGVSGYTKINTTALTTYTKIRSGFQLKSDYSTPSYVLVQAENSGETGSRVFVNSTAIPSQGDFSSTIELDTSATSNPYRDDSNGAGLGRFSAAPLKSVTYSNGIESLVWSGEEAPVAAFFTLENADPYNSGALPKEATDAVNNELATTENTVVVGEAGNRDYFIVFTIRPIQGVYFDVSSANTTTAVLDIHYWKNDASWAALTEADGTLVTGKTLAQDGWVTWNFASDAAPYHFEGNYYYAYRFYINDSAANTATATLQTVYVNAPMQEITDLWDGIPRQPIQFQIWRNGDSKFKQFTEEVNIVSYESAPLVAQLDGLTSSDYMLIASDDRLSAIQFDFIAGWVNTTASRTVAVYYWNGDTWVSVTHVDGTLLSTATMGQNGLVWWQPPAESLEVKKTQLGVTGYFYKVIPSNTLSGTYSDEDDIMTEAGDIALDLVTVIPAQKTIEPYKFTSQYKNRVLGCAPIQSKQGNRCDFTQKYSNAIWNGADSSDDGLQSLYFETSEDLTGGAEVYNRYGSQVLTVWTAFTNSETHVLKGDSPEDFSVIKVSENIGCPAPLTIATVEVGYEVAEGLKRNIIIWLSAAGPYGFDGQVLFPIKGIDKYFDPNETDVINFDEISRSRGWHSQSKKEYNLLIPSGASQTTNNVWLVYDLVKKKWFQKDTGDGSMPQVGFPVEDTYGANYVYGGIDSGYMMRLENGNDWDGNDIEQSVVTGDFWLTSILDWSRIVYFKLVTKRTDEDHEIEVVHYPDTEASAGYSDNWTDSVDDLFTDTANDLWSITTSVSLAYTSNLGTDRLSQYYSLTDWPGGAHRLMFRGTTDETPLGFQPVAWAIGYRREQRDD